LADVAERDKKIGMKKRKAKLPPNLTRQAELWLKAIGRYHLVTANVPSARSIMYAAAKNAGLKIRTEHRGNGLVIGTVIEEDHA